MTSALKIQENDVSGGLHFAPHFHDIGHSYHVVRSQENDLYWLIIPSIEERAYCEARQPEITPLARLHSLANLKGLAAAPGNQIKPEFLGSSGASPAQQYEGAARVFEALIKDISSGAADIKDIPLISREHLERIDGSLRGTKGVIESYGIRVIENYPHYDSASWTGRGFTGFKPTTFSY